MTTPIDLLVSVLTLVLGFLIAALPARAARIWAPEYLRRLAPESRISLLRRYRAFGILLSLAGALFGIDSAWFSN